MTRDPVVPRRSRGLAPAAVVVLVVLLALTGCTAGGDHPGARSTEAAAAPASPGASSGASASAGASSSSGSYGSPSAAAAGPPPAPRRGGCHDLTRGQLVQPTDSRPAVPCSQPHTTVTIYVGRLDTVVDGHALAVDSERAQRQQARVCPQQLARFLGGSPSRRRLSRFAVVWFSPTIAQGGQGADWFRCDVVAFGGDDTLAQLPSYRLLHDVLDQPSALDRYGLCGTAAPGAAGFSRVVCGRSHSWQAVATLPLSGGRRYPGTATVRQAGDQPCQDIVHGRDPSALTYRYGWEWPTREQWDGGQHYGFCWAPDAG